MKGKDFELVEVTGTVVGKCEDAVLIHLPPSVHKRLRWDMPSPIYRNPEGVSIHHSVSRSLQPVKDYLHNGDRAHPRLQQFEKLLQSGQKI